MFKRFISYYGPQKGLFIADTICALVYAGIDLAFPILLRFLTGGFFAEGSSVIMDGLLYIALGLVIMYAVRTACVYFVSAQGHIMGARMGPRCARIFLTSTSASALRISTRTARAI